MSDVEAFASKAAELRQAFDRSFALPPARAAQEVEDLLAIRVAGDAYAVRLRDITAVVTGRKVIPVPASTLDFLGLAGIRAGVVPVFGLASILGYAQATDSPRWMILCGADEPIALGFSDFEGHLRVPKSNLHVGESLHAARQYVEAVTSTLTGPRAVIGIPLVVATIRNRAGQGRPAKEQ